MGNRKTDTLQYNKFVNFLSKSFCTVFFVGKIPFAPGTFGSLAAFPIFILLLWLITSIITNIGNFLFVTSIALIILFWLGVLTSNIHARNSGKNDASEIVIDEVVGMLLLLFADFVLYCIATNFIHMDGFNAKAGFLYPKYAVVSFITCFILFRVFDIIKPWPIRNIEANFKNGFGVMIDDVLAAIYALIIHIPISYWLLYTESGYIFFDKTVIEVIANVLKWFN